MVNHEPVAAGSPAPAAGSPAPAPARTGRIVLQVAELDGALHLQTAMGAEDTLALLLAVAVKLGADTGQPFRVVPVERTTPSGIVLPGPGAAPRAPVQRPQ